MSRTRFLAFWMIVFGLLLTLLGGVAFAAGSGINFETSLGAIPQTICNGARFLRGPVGGALVVGMLVWGILRWTAGNRGGIGLMVTAVVAGLVLVALPTMVSIFQLQNCTI